ncbi:acyl-CoA dehydrogenase family protein [Caulobacter sp. S45]|uniref:acyl-CoA dehydrogenase family protein n=1 Tax=Caulobacter sp. S45 TaxID=1641861 RepID=UPI00131B55C9|nr:acyl-CoA dehydrogenase family protein [Caulobacter sp. S45]
MSVHALETAVRTPQPIATADIAARAKRVATIAAHHAEAVDRDGRFPVEAFDALKAERLLSVMVPTSLGGGGASVGQVVDICYALGRACSSTAMIFAMHQIKAACLIRHGAHEPWHADFLRRVSSDQLLLASSTTEGQGGGDVRSSAAAVRVEDGRIHLERDATVMSYGAQADAVVTTARRDGDAASSDQVLIVFEKADYTLTPTQAWETLGMRGTCSAGFALKAQGAPAQVLAEPYALIHAHTMTPTAHLLWSGVWTGVAAAASERAQRFLRKASRKAGGQLPPGAAHYARATASLRMLKSLIAGAQAEYEGLLDDPRALAHLDFQTRITLLKVEASELAVATVMSAMRACGLSGYRNDGEASIGRLLRDVLSAPIMINNDRILANLGASSLLSDVPTSLIG